MVAFCEFQPTFEVFISQRLAISPIARLIRGRDHGTHAVTIGRGHFHGVGKHIAGFDAEHLGPLIRAEVRHGFGLLRPGIPDDGRAGILFRDMDVATKHRVRLLQRTLSIEIDAIGFL